MLKVKVTAKTRPQSYRIERDTLLLADDGTLRLVKAGTVVTVPVPDEREGLEVSCDLVGAN